jgi:membrane protein implicated in regulation of membrane protease activity
MISVSLILLISLLTWLVYRFFRYFLKFKSPFAFVVGCFWLLIELLVLDVHLTILNKVDYASMFPLLLDPNFNWFLSIIIILILLSLRQMYKGRLIEKTLTDIVRGIALDKAIKN